MTSNLSFMSLCLSLYQTGFQVVLWLWPGSSRPCSGYCPGPEFSLSAAAHAWDATPLPVHSQHNHKVCARSFDLTSHRLSLLSYCWEIIHWSCVESFDVGYFSSKHWYQNLFSMWSELPSMRFNRSWQIFCLPGHTEASTCPTLCLMSHWRTICPEWLLPSHTLSPPLPPEPWLWVFGPALTLHLFLSAV